MIEQGDANPLKYGNALARKQEYDHLVVVEVADDVPRIGKTSFKELELLKLKAVAMTVS